MQHQYNPHSRNSPLHYVTVQQLKILAIMVDVNVNDNGIEIYGLNNFLTF